MDRSIISPGNATVNRSKNTSVFSWNNPGLEVLANLYPPEPNLLWVSINLLFLKKASHEKLGEFEMKMIVIFKFSVGAKAWDTFTYGIFMNDKSVCEMLSNTTF